MSILNGSIIVSTTSEISATIWQPYGRTPGKAHAQAQQRKWNVNEWSQFEKPLLWWDLEDMSHLAILTRLFLLFTWNYIFWRTFYANFFSALPFQNLFVGFPEKPSWEFLWATCGVKRIHTVVDRWEFPGNLKIFLNFLFLRRVVKQNSLSFRTNLFWNLFKCFSQFSFWFAFGCSFQVSFISKQTMCLYWWSSRTRQLVFFFFIFSHSWSPKLHCCCTHILKGCFFSRSSSCQIIYDFLRSKSNSSRLWCQNLYFLSLLLVFFPFPLEVLDLCRIRRRRRRNIRHINKFGGS